MDYLAATNVLLIVGVLVKEFVLPYFRSYMKAKASNLAAIEDSDRITKIVEGVKSEFARSLEIHKNDLINQRTKADWQRAEYKEKVLVFKKVARLSSSSLSSLKFHHALVSGWYASYAIGKAEGIDEAYAKHCLSEYDRLSGSVEQHWSEWKSLIIDLKDVTYDLDIYYSPSFADRARELVILLESLIGPAIVKEQMIDLATEKTKLIANMDLLRDSLRVDYDRAWMGANPGQFPAELLDSMRVYLRDQAAAFN